MESTVKKIVLELGADLCGLAHIESFSQAPPGFHPADIFSRCRSVVVLAKRLPRGAGEVNPRIVYNRANDLNILEVDRLAYLSALAIENLGATAVPLPSDSPYDYWDEAKSRGRGVLSMRHSAVLAGRGRLGRSTRGCNRQFGNMLTLGAGLTDRDLKSDPPAEELCPDNCGLCLKACPSRALDGTTVDQQRCRPHTYGVNARGFGVVNCNLCRTGCPLSLGVRPGPAS